MARMTLNDLERGIVSAAGGNLVSLFLFGSAARGDYDDRSSDLNTALILERAGADALRPLGDTVRRWTRSGQPAPLIFAHEGWRASTDVFPIEIEDMRDAHRLLAGTDPFEGLTTRPDDLRRELEREARGKLVQLRAEYVAAEADGKALGRLLEHSARTFFVLFRAAVRLRGDVPPAAHQTLVREAAALSGFPAEAFDWVLTRIGGRRSDNLSAYDEKAAAYLAAIEGFVHFVDQHAHKENG